MARHNKLSSFDMAKALLKGGTVSYEDRKLTWNSGVRKAIGRGPAEEEVRKHQNRMTGAWKQIS